MKAIRVVHNIDYYIKASLIISYALAFYSFFCITKQNTATDSPGLYTITEYGAQH